MSGHTLGRWEVFGSEYDDTAYVMPAGQWEGRGGPLTVAIIPPKSDNADANARLIAAAPMMYDEMLRFLPVLERAESDPEVWAKLTAGLGIATANSYRAAIARATGEGNE